jgi:hypothetical protein
VSEKRNYRKLTAQQKTELVLASLRGQKTVAEICARTTSLRRCCVAGASTFSRPALIA